MGDNAQPSTPGLLDNPSGKPSLGRRIQLITTLAGVGAIAAGLVLAFIEVHTKSGTNQGSTIVLAGLGAVFSGAAAHTGQSWAETRMNGPGGPGR